MRKPSKKALAVLTTAALLAGGGTAFAYWTTTGSGSGTAVTGTSTAITVNQTTSITGMGPSVAAKTLTGTFTNNATDAVPVHVTSVTVSIGTITGGVGTPACTADDYALTGATMTANQQVPVGTAVGSWTGATIAFNNTTANQDACKGATVNLVYSIVSS